MTTPSKNEGPTVLWNMLKGKKVKTNDGKDVGEIKEISQNFLRVEKGTISKDKFWIPKYVADAYDGKTLWLLVGKEHLLQRYLYGEEPPAEQYTKDFETFKTSPHGQKTPSRTDYDQSVRLIDERPTSGTITQQEDTETGYKSVRDLE
ncbi:MAG: hypothetical protein WBW34_00390 [Nitrososphaeraceae archaeon]